MIYLVNTTEAQEVQIPNNGAEVSGGLHMMIKSTIDKTERMMDVADLALSSLYHSIAVSLPSRTASGEYEYALADDDKVLATGLLVVGYEANVDEYNKTIEYEQYNS